MARRTIRARLRPDGGFRGKAAWPHALTLALLLPASSFAGTLDGHWTGQLVFREAPTEVRLGIETGETGPSVELDIPSLMMAREPVPARASGDGLVVELPFGLGPVTLRAGADTLSGEKSLGGDVLGWTLARSPPPAYRLDPVTFTATGTPLAGTLVIPDGPGPHPAVVLLHGSAAGTRSHWSYRSWADFFARNGIAALAYDRRGEGASAGEAGTSLATLAADAAAAISWLRSRPDIDADRIGLKAGSQGAWVAEATAARAGSIAFMVLTSAPAGTPAEQHRQQLAYGMRADGRPEDQVQDALAYLGLYFYVARTGRGWHALEEAMAVARAEPWGEYVDQPRSPADLQWWAENHDFQPIPMLARLHMPVLLLYGDDDWIVPPQANARLLKSRFGSPSRVTVRVFDAADHRLEIPSGTDASGRWRWPRLADGAIETIVEWLHANVHTPTAPRQETRPPMD